MKRRDFLRATLVTAGGLFVPACSGEPESTQTSPPWTLTPGETYFPQSIASGDPKPGSVIVWTRVIDPDNASDLTVHLEIALDAGFKSILELAGQQRIQATAEAAFDHCVKIKVGGLAPGATYYYRFIYTKGDIHYTSRTGRTRTAPAEDADVPVRFAFVSCQDYIGRYYNPYRHLADPTAFDLDFFVHLGDYIYETTGDPSFQVPNDNRKVTFADQAGAITLTATNGDMYYAARSLDNYRDLYRTYRADPALQAMHERMPMVAIWDDHEFSDDCYGASATYFGGAQNEMDVNRRKAANQAWFEYMPVDYAEGDFRYDSAKAFPGDIRIYRDFAFGKNVHLILTDLRTYRPDHQIPEDAFPGTVWADEATLTAAFGSLPALASPYVNIDDYPMHKATLTTGAAMLGYDAAAVAGNLSVLFINTVALQIDPMLMPIDPMQPGLLRGFAFVDMGKGGFYSSIGSRYLVVKEVFEVYSADRYAASPASQDVMGPEQEAWFLSTIASSKHTWKVWCNEFCLSPLQIDLSTTSSIPVQFQRRFYMNTDDWSGFRDKRDALLTELSATGNVVAITGDIHAFFASTPMVQADPTKKIVEFVGSSISSAAYRDLLVSQVENEPSLAPVKDQAVLLAAAIDTLFTSTTAKINPHLGYANSGVNGFSIVEATSSDFTVTFYEIGSKEATMDHSGDAALAALFAPKRFRTLAGESELYQEIAGAWKRWDPATFAWV